jgi:hypothetical protein
MSNATPMHADRRRGQYERQNNGGVMTPRQRRRWKHKLNRALLAQAKAAKA